MAMQERAVRTRTTLIRSAAEIFDADGFVAASISAISTRAGVSGGALHFHFPSKGALAEAIEAEAERRLQLITGRAEEPVDCPLRTLVDASHRLFDQLNRDIVLRAGFSLGCEAAWQGKVDLHAQWKDWIEETLVSAADRGVLADGTTAQDAATVVAASTVGFEALGRKNPEWLSPQRLGRFWRLMLPCLERAEVPLQKGTT
ncbi:ScbR family autoregulator-binding transcription factor [Streptomyces omiyaensis]|uniref:ScbR family autoregulator-binding transcription factor n=1 Tax=Streptomyces omiyaensis TaxID=68247 RepID=A0ABW7C361_9ACTN|nr:ScbR family autoregulator-binding transcription factor [Streptomyces omiyaensis]GGY84604.1 TetR family transcriptional regulator [Streptomyces omiyaensis]